MKTRFLSTSVSILAVSGALGLAGPLAAATEPELENYIEIGGGGAWVDGDAAAFQQRHGLARKGYGGITDFLYSKATTNGTLTTSGHALWENHDYLFSLRYDHNTKGYFRAGLRSFRLWSDESGDVVPASGLLGGLTSYGLGGDFYALDRTELFAEGLFKPTELIDLHLKVSHTLRDGMKASTMQGATSHTRPGARNIVPAAWNIDEQRTVVDLDATLRNENATLTTAVRLDYADNDNARYIRHNPNEALDRSVTTREQTDTDLFHVRAITTNRINDRVFLSAAYAYTTIDTTLGGSRIYGREFDALYDPTFVRTGNNHGYFDLTGGTDTKQHVTNLNLMYEVDDYWVIVPSFRFEREGREGLVDFEETNQIAGFVPEAFEDSSDRDWKEWTTAVETRYTRLKGWVFTGRAEWAEGNGQLTEQQVLFEGTPHVEVSRDSDYTRWVEKYSAAANWYPVTWANVSLSAGRKERHTDYDNSADSTSNAGGGDRYPAFVKSQKFSTDDFAVRLTLRPLRGLTAVTRVDFQKTDVASHEVGLTTVNSAKIKSTILSQSLTWSPASRLFLQGAINHVSDEIDTPANSITGTAAGLVQLSENNYWNANLTAGIVLDDTTDLTLSYDHCFIDNWVDNSAKTVPYLSSAREHLAQATLTRRINRNLSVSFKYAYARNDDISSAHLNDYEAHLLYTKVQFRF